MTINEENLMFRNLLARRVLGAIAVALFAVVPTVRAEESLYYMIIFGQQDRVNRVESSHTFASFVKVTGEGTDKSKHVIETHTISWMPRSMQVKLRFEPEDGVNLDLKESLQAAKMAKTEVSMWGPFRIKKELYENAVRQEERLRKGTVAYKVIDVRFRPEKATNCIHAVSDIDTENGLLATVTARGNEASVIVLRHLSRWIIEPEEKNEWLSKRLELGEDLIRPEVRIVETEGVKK
jgi:hypothetical protein